ncbi:MAG: extracellular solute-binding protein, partial [Planctomycetes bacterium]|nr:extracellular solute-binding protein [Planctomycetota bacterium]
MFKPRQTVTGLLNGVIGLVLGPKSLSPGCRLIVALAVTSTAAIALRSGRDAADLEFWVFARPHHDLYMAPIADWNAHEETSIDLHLLSLPALERRMMSGFLSDVPVADLIEADVRVASRAFTGPLEDVGFLDITDRIRDEGIADEINAPSFSPWTRQGRIFGLPHDVHPVLLCYRRDLVEAAGIDPRGIETWDDFARVLAPLMADHDGDGRPDRYLLNVWDTQIDTIEALVLQAGGRYFDDDGAVVIDSEV